MPPRIPGVELGEIIGRGGNAIVYLGVQEAVRRSVAVKIENRAVSEERNRRRFLREASAASRISSHPHVVSLIDVGTTDEDHPYLVMELCEGGSVGRLLKRSGPLPVVDALDIGIAVAGALAAAHEAGILHRDVKPANILIDAYGTPRLSDFGLAATIVPGEAFSATVEALTPAYAAPEVFAQDVPTPRADVWAMAATIYAMLVGGAPRRRPDGTSLPLTELLPALPRPLPVPEVEGADLVMPVLWRAMAYNPEDRYPTAAELREDLIAVRAEFGPSTGRVGGPEVMVVGAKPGLAETDTASNPTFPPPPSEPEPARGGRRGAVVVGAIAAAVVGAGAMWAAVSPSSPWATDGGSPAAADPVATIEATADPTEDLGDLSDEPAPEPGTCWGGIVSIGGGIAAREVSCEEEHVWETYASGLLDEATTSASADDVSADPKVAATCTIAALADYIGNDDVADLWVSVIPPSEAEFLAGARGYACVVGGGTSTGSLQG